MGDIVGQIRQERFINVEDPSIHSIIWNLNCISKRQRQVSHSSWIWRITIPGHVVLNEGSASFRDQSPETSVISLNSEAPAITVESIVIGNLAVAEHAIDGKKVQ